MAYALAPATVSNVTRAKAIQAWATNAQSTVPLVRLLAPANTAWPLARPLVPVDPRVLAVSASLTAVALLVQPPTTDNLASLVPWLLPRSQRATMAFVALQLEEERAPAAALLIAALMRRSTVRMAHARLDAKRMQAAALRRP